MEAAQESGVLLCRVSQGLGAGEQPNRDLSLPVFAEKWPEAQGLG